MEDRERERERQGGIEGRDQVRGGQRGRSKER